MPGSVIRDLLAAARQMDETMVSAFTAACSFRRLDLALVNPGTVQTILVDDVTAAGGTAEEWSDGDLTTVRGAQKLRDWIVMKNLRTVWFCCPTENSTPSENDHLTAAQSRSREHRIQRHMSNLASDMASSGQCDFGRYVSTSCESFSLVSPIDANCSSTSSSDGTFGTGCRSHHQTTTSEQTDDSKSPHQETAVVW